MAAQIDVEGIREFIYQEAALIDCKSLDEWHDLFADDALYWMPLARGQSEADLHNALFFEDKLLLRVRIDRLSHPRAFSQAPASHCQHVLQRPRVAPWVAGAMIETTTPFVYVECQRDEQIVLAGVAHHRLIHDNGVTRIHRKRIDLLNRDAALPSIQLFL